MNHRWKPMDVAYGDNLHHPRLLILQVDGKHELFRYTVAHESGGVCSRSEDNLRTLDEWLVWIDRFSDDLTGRQLREAKEAARATFVEPQYWIDFRARFAATGDPWFKPAAKADKKEAA